MDTISIDELRVAFTKADEHAARCYPGSHAAAPDRLASAYGFVRGYLGITEEV